MKAKEVKKYILISLALIIVSVMSVHFYNKYRICQEYIEKEIYEIKKTFFAREETLSTFCMICESRSGRVGLIEMVKRFIVKNDLINDLKSRKPDFKGKKIEINFVEPSKDFPIGWNYGIYADFWRSIVLETEDAVLIVDIPWDSTDIEDENIEYHFTADLKNRYVFTNYSKPYIGPE